MTTADGTGLPGVTVALVGPTGTTATVVSGDGGVFSASDLAPGTWSLTASLPGFVAAPAMPITLTAGVVRTVRVTLGEARFFASAAVTGSVPHDLLSYGELRETGARELDDALIRTPGVHRLRKGGIASDVVVRGYQGANLNVLIDGVRVQGACPGHMDPPAFHADLAEIDRVEVAPGPFDVKNAGSLGGLVNVVTKRPTAGLTVNATLLAGSASFVNPAVTVSQGSADVSVLAGISYRTSRPYSDGDGKRFTTVANYRSDAQDSDAYRVGTAWGRATVTLGERGELQVAYTRQQADHVLYPYLQMDALFDNTDRASVEWTRRGEEATLRAQTFLTRVNHFMTDEFRTSAAGMPRAYSMATRASTATLGGRFEAETGAFTLGVEAFRRGWDATNEMAGMAYRPQYVVPDVQIATVGAYLAWRQALSGRTTLAAGVRFDRTDSRADATRANTDLYWAYAQTRSTRATDSLPSGHLRLTTAAGPFELGAGIGRTVRVPDAQERYYAAMRKGTDWVGDPTLAPTVALGVHVQASLRAGRVAATLTAFRDELSDYVTLLDRARVVPGMGNTYARSYANVDARMSGAELALSAPLADRFFVSLDAAWVRGTQTPRPELGIRSEDLAEISPLTSRLAFRWDRGTAFVEIEGAFAAAQARVNTDVGEAPTAGWGVANLRVGGRRGPVALAVIVTNLTNRQYVEHLSYQRDPFRAGFRVPEPGRALTVSVQTAF